LEIDTHGSNETKYVYGSNEHMAAMMPYIGYRIVKSTYIG